MIIVLCHCFIVDILLAVKPQCRPRTTKTLYCRISHTRANTGANTGRAACIRINPITLLHDLARACGVAREWRDVEGCERIVPDATLELVIKALGHATGSEQQIRQSLATIDARKAQLPALLVGEAGGRIALPVAAQSVQATNEAGATMALEIDGQTLLLPPMPGYYALAVDGAATRLAVAPPRCPALADTGGKHWGVSLQIPSIRGARSSAFGNAGELAELATQLAAQGADALAISPVHALFPRDGLRFSPYSPSSRLFHNGLVGDPALLGLGDLPAEQAAALIDWEAAIPARFDALRKVFDGLRKPQRDEIVAKARASGPELERHALFDALDGHFRPQGAHGWRQWPKEFRRPDSPAVAQFARDNAGEIAFHLFLQWLARESMAKVQQAARRAGMAIGLIGDLAVGVDPSGSDCWAHGEAMLSGLTVGAPPDPLGPLGQNWALTSFSPTGLVETGFAPFIAMLRAGLAAAGGLRIDHAFGLGRLWVIPEGGGAQDGAYLAFPQEELLQLVTLEAHRANAIIIAEDLGTAPPGFTHALEQRGMMGMQVLWFQRAPDNGFIGAQDYAASSVAMSGTHDTPTLAGWWQGADLDWAEKLGRLPDNVSREDAEGIRDWDRGLLWATIGGAEPRPAPNAPDAVIAAALRHCAATPSPLAIVAIEDVLGLVQQPNLPGTVHEHPNWRRRMAQPAAQLLERPEVQRRLQLLARAD